MIKETPAYVAQMNAGRYIKKRKRPTGLKNKLCKCNFPKINDNTKNAAKSGNAEE